MVNGKGGCAKPKQDGLGLLYGLVSQVPRGFCAPRVEWSCRAGARGPVDNWHRKYIFIHNETPFRRECERGVPWEVPLW